MKTHLPLLLRKALLAACLTAAATFATPASAEEEEGPIDNTTYGWDLTVYHDHDILFEYDPIGIYSATLIGNDKYDEDPIIDPTEDWDGMYSSINAFGGSGISSDIYVGYKAEIISETEVMASDSIIMGPESTLTGGHVTAGNSICVGYSSNLVANERLDASTLVIGEGGHVLVYGRAYLEKADQYRTWGLTAYWDPVGWYHTESGPTPFADDQKGCSILLLNGGYAGFGDGLTTKGNVYLDKESRIDLYNRGSIGGDVKLYDKSVFSLFPLGPIPYAPTFYQIAGNVELYGNSFMGVYADTTINGNLSIESGDVSCVIEDKYNSLTVGGNVSIGIKSSLKEGKNLTVTGDLVMQEDSMFDGFTGNVSAKNMQLRGDISFTGNNRRISTTEDLQTDGGNLTFNGQGMEVSVGKNLEVKNGGLSLTNTNATVGGKTNVAGDLTIANGEDNTLAFNADVSVGGAMNLQSGKLEFSWRDNISLSVGKDLTIGDGASLTGGHHLTVTGDLVMQEGSTFDGFTGDVSAKNMQLRGDLSFDKSDRHISTTENLQMDYGNLSFLGDRMELSVGRNLEVKNGGLTFEFVKADIGGDLVNQFDIVPGNDIALEINQSADVHVKGNLTANDVSMLGASLTVDGKTNLDGSLKASNGDNVGLSFGDIVYTEGSFYVGGGHLSTWNEAGDSAAAITAVDGLTLRIVKQGQLGDVTVDNQSAASDIVATIGAVIAGGGIWGEVVAQVIGIIDDWNRSGITLDYSEVQSLGTLYTSGEIAISKGSYQGVELNADSENLISEIIHVIDKVMLPEIKLGERGVTAAVTLTDTDVSLSGQIYSNGNLSVENTVLSAKNMKSTSSELAAVSISNGSTVTLEEGLESSGAVKVESSVLRTGGDFCVDATDVAIALFDALGWEDVVSFVDCEEISIGGTFSSNSSTYISNTTLTAKEMELASYWIASDLRIVNGSKVSIEGAISNKGSILIDGSQVSVGKGLSTGEPTLRPGVTVTTDITISNNALVDVKGAVSSEDKLEVTSGSQLIVHNLKDENGETLANGDVAAKAAVTVDAAELRADGNFTAEGSVTVKGEGATLTVGGDTVMGKGLHIEQHATVTLNGEAHIELTNLALVNGRLILVDALGSVTSSAYDLTLKELDVKGNGNAIEANLIMCDNAKLTFGEGALLTMGCAVTIGSGTDLTLEGDYEHTFVRLIESVEGLTLAGEEITRDGLYDAYGTIATLNGESIARGQYVISYNNSVVSFGAGSVPEPATATLSLLALAALAARRRRH